ncbi:MAG: M23 family metallopeptidase [Chloroflexota bacterium]
MRKLLIVAVLLFWTSIANGQTNERPLILPFQDAPSIDTWLLGQAYGNTTGAFRFGDRWYSAGQGLHFGLDFAAPCGTPLVAVADGTVAFVDNLNFGSAPHNLILRHEAISLTSLYGHLQNRAPVNVGDTVTQGQLVGYSGDPDSTCESRPHLHLEIRSLDYRTAFNPVDYMEANWHTLTLVGSFSNRNYQMDLDNSRQWQTLDDQPSVAFGGRILNAYAAPYPAEITPPANAQLARDTAPIASGSPIILRPFNSTGCCWEHWWHPMNVDLLYTVDGFANQRAGIFAYNAQSGELLDTLGAAPPPYYSPDLTHGIVMIDDATAQITHYSTGDMWSLVTGGAIPVLNTDNSRLLWINENGDFVPGLAEPESEVVVSDASGENARIITSQAGLDARWLDADRLLLSISERPYTQLDVYDVRDDSRYTLGRWHRPRSISIAPGGERLMFYLASQPNPADTGVYWMDIAPDTVPQRVSWFGSYRWRDANTAFVIPYNPDTEIHQLMLFTLSDSSMRPLTNPQTQPFTVMDGRWSVNADGTHILFRNANDRNLWMMDIATDD